MTIFITGGAGFIGSNFVYCWLEKFNEPIVNVDLLTYAGNLTNLKKFKSDPRHSFINGNILDNSLINNIFEKYQPRAIINFAAESHVDRSISSPEQFVHTNIVGTYNLLLCAKNYWLSLKNLEKEKFRFIQISTDEVFGSLEINEPSFTEESLISPNSPYSASKASADHFVRAFNKTYSLPTIITRCTNNYGPFQNVEKFIPLIIHNAINKKIIPLYGDGLNIRDWLYVKDHCLAIVEILKNGIVGETYNIGSQNEKTNKEIAHYICKMLDKIKPSKELNSYQDLINLVDDRLGHDKRYAINSKKCKKELNWEPEETFESGISKTVRWYLENKF